MRGFAVGFGRGFPRIWLLPISALTLLLGIAAFGGLSRSIAADFLAWWPVWVGVAIAAYLLRERNVGPLRAAGVVPLVALVFVGLFIWGHLAGWRVMPSASQRLVGPEVGEVTHAALTAEIDGVIEVTGGSEFLYVVEPVRSGGGVGIPGAAEQVIDSSVTAVLNPPADPGLYSYAGWDLRLSETPRWALQLDGALEADLTSLTLDSVRLNGGGVLRLGLVDGQVTVMVESGSFRIVLPAESPARVNGVASVPENWTPDAEGAAAPIFGEGWVITVAPGAEVTIVERQATSK